MQLVAVADAPCVVPQAGTGRDHVGDPMAPCEREPAGDVVVVDVRLEHGSKDESVRRQDQLRPVEVALGIDGDRPSVGERDIRPVPERGGIDGHDLEVRTAIHHVAASAA